MGGLLTGGTVLAGKALENGVPGLPSINSLMVGPNPSKGELVKDENGNPRIKVTKHDGSTELVIPGGNTSDGRSTKGWFPGLQGTLSQIKSDQRHEDAIKGLKENRDLKFKLAWGGLESGETIAGIQGGAQVTSTGITADASRDNTRTQTQSTERIETGRLGQQAEDRLALMATNAATMGQNAWTTAQQVQESRFKTDMEAAKLKYDTERVPWNALSKAAAGLGALGGVL